MTTTTVTPTTAPDLPPAVAARIAKSLVLWWWWDVTHNPFRGCSKVSPGCANCWALRDIEERMRHNPNGAYNGHTGPVFVPETLNAFARDLQPKRYFTPSVSDPYHEAFTDEQILAYFEAMNAAPWHWYFSLTKRSERLAQLGPYLPWREGICAVVSVETAEQLDRIEHLQACGAVRKGVSFEPIIDRVPLRTAENRALIQGLDYAIVGGETGPIEKIRPMKEKWAMEVIEVCLEEGVPVFGKQVGDVAFHEYDEEFDPAYYVGRKKAGRLFGGRTYDDLPLGCAEHLSRGVVLAEAERLRRRARR